MAEALDMTRHLYSPQRLAIGYRKILEEKVVTDGNGNAVRVDGKVLRKFRLSDYQWMTYGEVIDRVDCIARGLLVNGFERHQRIVMLAETCADNLMFVQSLISIGIVFVTVFATLGDEGEPNLIINLFIKSISDTMSWYKKIDEPNF
jgi:acyl-CoA synthetase (AMP-forming)/AMP-acid ligase II